MQEYLFLWAIAGVLLVGAMSPGPSFMVVAQNALAKSRRHGVATAVGTALGVALFAVLASFGVTTILERVPNLYVVFKLIGGAYLLFLAYRIWSVSKQQLMVPSDYSKTESTLFRAFVTGLITQTSNPKTALVIAGIFAAFVPEQSPPYSAVLVAIIAFVIDFSWYAVVAISLSTTRSRGLYQRSKTVFDRIAAVFLGLVGARLILG